MTFGAVLAIAIVVGFLMAFPLWATMPADVIGTSRYHKVATHWSGLFILVFVLVMSTRNVNFGFDTRTYIELFNNYCIGNEIQDNYSFRLSLLTIRVLSLGSCDQNFVRMAWVCCIIGSILLFVDAPYERRVVFSAALLFSLIGVELSSNALRQGLASGFLIAAYSRWPARPFSAAILAGVAVAFHSSMALTLVAAGLATLAWPLFLVAFVTVGSLILFALVTAFPALWLQPLLFEIQKYLQHPADEIWVRVLAAATVMAVLAAPIGASNWSATWARRGYQIALRMAFTCVPFLALPYFGYRYIYGIFPLILWRALDCDGDADRAQIRAFVLVLLFNGAVLLVWSLASSAMRDSLFYG